MFDAPDSIQVYRGSITYKSPLYSYCLICGETDSPVGQIHSSPSWFISDAGGNCQGYVHRLCAMRRIQIVKLKSKRLKKEFEEKEFHVER